MNRLNAILLFVVVLCACSVVTSQYSARMLYSDLQKEQKSQQQLDIEYGQLMLEQGTWGAHAVIEKAAETKLGMHTPDPRQVQVVTMSGAT